MVKVKLNNTIMTVDCYLKNSLIKGRPQNSLQGTVYVCSLLTLVQVVGGHNKYNLILKPRLSKTFRTLED